MALLIWTRSIDDWTHDDAILKKLSVDVLHLPCIAIRPLSVKFPRQKPHVFVITSTNGVKYAARHVALLNLMRTSESVFAIGPVTKEALAEHKISAEIPQGVDNAESLAQWLSHNLKPGTDVAWPCAKEPHYDITAHLAPYDIIVEALPVYETERSLHLPHGKHPDAPDIERYIQSLQGVVCFASPSAVQGFAKSLQPSDNRLKHELTAVSIGPSTTAACKGLFERIETAPEPSIESLAQTAAQQL
jgi:uroporphyrinogen-III synthase